MLKIILENYISWIGRLSEWTGRVASWLTTLLVVLICLDVALRYVFKEASALLPELEWHLFSLIFLIGAAYTLKHDRHVRVDVFYMRFSPRLKATINLIGALLFLLPFCLLVIDTSIPYIKASYVLQEHSADPGGLPHRYLIKGSIVVGFTLLLLQGMAMAASSLLIIIYGEPEKDRY
ncbi:TRAP transporter small permease subunit [Algivirga pacifica]|uniref:TRAP transporter small permease subunit n=1 Tax=Algivirga pacifica TaxID=1162670 RepID=A0ABP9CVU6_9BACT